MCEPTLIAGAGLLLSAAGTAATMQNNASQQSAAQAASDRQAQLSEQARVEGQAQQDALSKTAWQQWQDQLNASSANNAQDVINKGKSNLLDTTDKITNQVGLGQNSIPDGVDASASPEMKKAMAKAAARFSDMATSKIGALATLAGYGDVNAQTAQREQTFNSKLGVLNDIRNSALKTSMLAGAVPAGTVYNQGGGVGQAASAVGSAGLGYATRKGAFADLLGTDNPDASVPRDGWGATAALTPPPPAPVYTPTSFQ